MNSMFYVDGINLSAVGTLTTYVDDVTVSSVPEPSSIILIAMGILTVSVAATRRRRARSPYRLNATRSSDGLT